MIFPLFWSYLISFAFFNIIRKIFIENLRNVQLAGDLIIFNMFVLLLNAFLLMLGCSFSFYVQCSLSETKFNKQSINLIFFLYLCIIWKYTFPTVSCIVLMTNWKYFWYKIFKFYLTCFAILHNIFHGQYENGFFLCYVIFSNNVVLVFALMYIYVKV